MPDDTDVARRLADALHAGAETVRPEPALHSILTRTRSAESRSRRWWPALAGTVVAGGLVAAALVLLTPGRTSEPVPEPPVATGSEPTKPPPSAVTVYFTNPDERLVRETVPVEATGDLGLDAVNALLTAEPSDPDYDNGWTCAGQTHRASSVAIEGDVVSVTVQVREGANGRVCASYLSEAMQQQMVYTVETALGGPVLLVRVETADEEWMAEPPDPYARAAVQIEGPEQGQTVSSPVTVYGQSATFEANVVWRIKQDGEVVDQGFVTSKGANGVQGPFKFTVDLPAGDYTVEAYEESAENGEIINLDSKDFTVE